MTLTYTTITTTAEAEFRDRGSKFLAYAYPIHSQDDVKKYLNELKALHPKAVHHCYAWRLGIDGNSFRANDDGEPSGSAGRPILGQIDSKSVTNTLVVVVRYFGGTLLGVPGLINAYKLVTAEALKDIPTIEKDLTKNLMLEYDYTIMNEVLYTLKQHQADILKNDMMLFCETTVALPLKTYDAALEKLSKIHGLTIKTDV